jgi:hypothetical protein
MIDEYGAWSTDKRKPKFMEKKLLQCQFFHGKSHMDDSTND